jgi:hypothetical protein
MVYLSLKGKIVSFIKEKKLPWSAIVDVEKARLPSDSLATANIPLLESIGTSDMPDFSPEFILQILPSKVYNECQAYEENNLLLHGQAGEDAVTLISVLLLSLYVQRPNNPPDERVECDPKEEEDPLSKYQPIYERGCESAITVIKATRANSDGFGIDGNASDDDNLAAVDGNDDGGDNDDVDENDRGGSAIHAGGNNPCTSDDDIDTFQCVKTKQRGGRKPKEGGSDKTKSKG